jgi:hypothetical protein
VAFKRLIIFFKIIFYWWLIQIVKVVNYMTSKYPEWAIILYRGIRTAIGAGLAQALILQPDWTKPEEAYKTLGVAFLAGFAVSFGKWLRNYLDKEFGYTANSKVSKLMPI